MNDFLAFFKKPALILILVAGVLLPQTQPSWALLDEFKSLSIEKERDIGEQFLLELQQQVPLVEDPFITSYINRLGQKLAAQMGPQPFKYKFFVLQDPTMNAFAVPGGYVFLHTGMIRMAEREGELAGVIAHEISHIYCRHMAKMMEKARAVSIASLVAGLASVFLGGAMAAPLIMGSMAGGESAMLAYSRDFEAEADATGFKWMLKAGYNPRDMVSMFNKMNKHRWFEGGKTPLYLSTHPFTDDRIVELSHKLSMYQDELPRAVDNPEFEYFNIKLESICGNPHQLFRRMTQDAIREPKNPLFQYGKALALAKLDRAEEALAAFQQAQKLDPGNDAILTDLATYYFQRNRYVDAQKLLEDLSRRHPQEGVTLFYLGRIYQERHQIDQALPLFEKVHNLNPAFTEVYLNLGTIYGEKGQLGPAHYYLGFHSLKTKSYPTALFHFQKARQNLSPTDPRYGEVKRQVSRLEKMRIRVHN